LNPKFAIELAATLCELRVRGTGVMIAFVVRYRKRLDATRARLPRPVDAT
jgi:hypothetical protein